MSGEALIGLVVVGGFVWMVADFMKPSKKSKPKAADMPDNPPPPANPEIQGNFDANSFNRAKAIMAALKQYPDEVGKTMALAYELYRDSARQNTQQARQQADFNTVKGLLDMFRTVGNQASQTGNQNQQGGNYQQPINGAPYNPDQWGNAYQGQQAGNGQTNMYYRPSNNQWEA